MMKAPVRMIIVILIGCFLLTACDRGPALTEEDKVRATLDAFEVAAQERSLSAMVKHISPEYRDFEGNDFAKVKRLLQFQLIKNQSINIFSKVRELEVIGNAATVELSVAMASRGVDLSLEEGRLRADTHRFSILLKSNNQEWKIRSVSWQRGW
jgi:preprotein translocase subunit SecA